MLTLTLPPVPGVYRIVDASSGRFYIGSSVNMEKRWRQHRERLARGTHPNPVLQAIWNVDPDRLTAAAICTTERSRDALLAAEQAELDASAVGRNQLCMNVLLVAGSHLGRKRSAETCARLAAAQMGRRASAETREKQRIAKLGRPLSAEHRRKLGDAARGKKLPPRDRLPRSELRRFTDDQVREIRAAKAQGASYTQIEGQFNLSRGALMRMLRRETYAEVA